MCASSCCLFCLFWRCCRWRCFVLLFARVLSFHDFVVILLIWSWYCDSEQSRTHSEQFVFNIQSCPHLNWMHDFPKSMMMFAIFFESLFHLKFNTKSIFDDAMKSGKNSLGSLTSLFCNFLSFFAQTRTHSITWKRQGKQLLFVDKTQHFNSIGVSCSKREK